MHLLRLTKENISLSLIIFVYFFFRLISLTRLPLFNDEAIYIRWAQIIISQPSQLFLPLEWGRQPLFIWALIPFITLFQDPLFGARLVSVLAGACSLIGLWLVTRKLFQSVFVAYASCFLYVFYPFAHVYDRIALLDSMVGAFSIWSLYLAILITKKVKVVLAVSLGVILGLGLLTKSNGIFSVYLLPVVLILFQTKKKERRLTFIKWIGSIVCSIIIAQVLYGILYFSPNARRVLDVNGIFIYPLKEWIHLPLSFIIENFFRNFSVLLGYFTGYAKISYVLLLGFSIVTLRQFTKEKILLFLYFFLPFCAFSLFGRGLNPRYIYPMTLFLLPLMAWSLSYIVNRLLANVHDQKKKIILASLIIFIVVSQQGFIMLQYIFDPARVSIPYKDKQAYIIDNPGWEISDSVRLLQREAIDKKIFIGTEGVLGILPQGLEIYLKENKNVTLKGYQDVAMLPDEVKKNAQDMSTYYVFYSPMNQNIPQSPQLTLMYEKRYGTKPYFYRIFKINPD